MQNIEVKFTLPHPQSLRKRLELMPAVRFQYRHYQNDIYFNTRANRLKIRIEEAKKPCLIEYYRADLGRPRLSNYSLSAIDDLPATLKRLRESYGEIATVEKWRELYLYENVRIHIDEVPHLGWFVEFESVVSADISREEARHRLKELLDELQEFLGEAQSSGYLELLTSSR